MEGKVGGFCVSLADNLRTIFVNGFAVLLSEGLTVVGVSAVGAHHRVDKVDADEGFVFVRPGDRFKLLMD